MSRGDRRHQRSIETAVHKLEQRHGRAPVESEIAREMGLSLTADQELLGKVRGTQLIYLEDMSGDEAGSSALASRAVVFSTVQSMVGVGEDDYPSSGQNRRRVGRADRLRSCRAPYAAGGARHMSQTTANLGDHVIPHVPVRR